MEDLWAAMTLDLISVLEKLKSLGTQELSSGIFPKIHHSACGIKTGPTEMARGWEPPLKTWTKTEASSLDRTKDSMQSS